MPLSDGDACGDWTGGGGGGGHSGGEVGECFRFRALDALHSSMLGMSTGAIDRFPSFEALFVIGEVGMLGVESQHLELDGVHLVDRASFVGRLEWAWRWHTLQMGNLLFEGDAIVLEHVAVEVVGEPAVASHVGAC